QELGLDPIRRHEGLALGHLLPTTSEADRHADADLVEGGQGLGDPPRVDVAHADAAAVLIKIEVHFFLLSLPRDDGAGSSPFTRRPGGMPVRRVKFRLTTSRGCVTYPASLICLGPRLLSRTRVLLFPPRR